MSISDATNDEHNNARHVPSPSTESNGVRHFVSSSAEYIDETERMAHSKPSEEWNGRDILPGRYWRR